MKALALAMFIAAGNAIAQGIPVFDPAANQSQIKSLAYMAEQIQSLKQQVDQAQRQYDSLTGSRGLGSVINDPRLRQMLPEKIQVLYRDNPAIAAAIQEIFRQETLGPSASANRTAIVNRTRNAAATQHYVATTGYEGAQQRVGQLDALMGQINQTNDPKAIAELQARIGIEQAAIQNENNKLQLLRQIHSAEMQLIQEQRAEMSRRVLDPSTKNMPRL